MRSHVNQNLTYPNLAFQQLPVSRTIQHYNPVSDAASAKLSKVEILEPHRQTQSHVCPIHSGNLMRPHLQMPPRPIEGMNLMGGHTFQNNRVSNCQHVMQSDHSRSWPESGPNLGNCFPLFFQLSSQMGPEILARWLANNMWMNQQMHGQVKKDDQTHRYTYRLSGNGNQSFSNNYQPLSNL